MATSPHEPSSNSRLSVSECPTSPPLPTSKPIEVVVSAAERNAVLKALYEARKPLVMWMISKISGISQRRMEDILPVLVHNGFVQREDAADAVRYSRICRPAPDWEKMDVTPSPKEPFDSPCSPINTSHPPVRVSTPTGVVSTQTRNSVFKALDEAAKPLVMWKLAESCGIDLGILEQVLSVLVGEGSVKRVDAADAVRYSRARVDVSPAKSHNDDHLKSLGRTAPDEALNGASVGEPDESLPSSRTRLACCFSCGRDVRVHAKHYDPEEHYYCWRCLRPGTTQISDQKDRPSLPTDIREADVSADV